MGKIRTELKKYGTKMERSLKHFHLQKIRRMEFFVVGTRRECGKKIYLRLIIIMNASGYLMLRGKQFRARSIKPNLNMIRH